MPDMLHLKPEEIDTTEKRSQYSVCVVGCERSGIIYALLFAKAGFKVTCADENQSLVKSLAKGRATLFSRGFDPELRGYIRTGTLSATSNLQSVVSCSDIVVLTGTLKVDDKGKPYFSEVEKSCKQIGSSVQRGALVIYTGAPRFGFTEEVVKETLQSVSGFKAGQDFGLAYANTYVPEGEADTEAISEQELLVAADDKASLTAASIVLSTIAKDGIRQAANTKLAELTTLFAFARRNVTVALANELAILCENAGVDYFETLKLTKLECRESDFAPAIDLKGMNLWTQLLLESAENLGDKPGLLDLARRVHEDMVRHAVVLTQDALRDCEKTLRRSRIAIFGASGPGTSGVAFVKMLEAKGARINLYDPSGGRNEESESTNAPKRNLTEAVENCDCIVILSAKDQFRRLNLKGLRSAMRTPAAIVDLAGVVNQERVRGEGFLYRGLGRGVERE
jgi:UDP-N-acetyl-D-mannosaminuronic acid dehydrogenase